MTDYPTHTHTHTHAHTHTPTQVVTAQVEPATAADAGLVVVQATAEPML